MGTCDGVAVVAAVVGWVDPVVVVVGIVTVVMLLLFFRLIVNIIVTMGRQ